MITLTVRIVRKLLLFLFTASAACSLAACASNKPSAHIYDGDAPTIRYAPSHAGGPQSVY